MNRSHPQALGEFLAGVHRGLSALDPDRSLLTSRQRLAGIADALRAADRLHALAVALIGEATTTGAAEEVHGTDLRTWLTDGQRLTRAQAGALVHQAHDLQRFPDLTEAALDGRANRQQTQAVVSVLKKLPDEVGFDAERAAEATMVDYCGSFNSIELGRLSRHLLEVVAPEVVEQAEEVRLERELRVALRDRFLSFSPDGQGSTLIKGSLPVADAQLLQAQLDALAHQQHRTLLDALDPLAQTTTLAMNRADALVELARRAAAHQDAPRHGGDRPRLVVTIDYERLLADCTRAGILDSGHELTAGQVRQVACDADLLPVVLGGRSSVLDVGREHRLVTPELRAALHVRDRGCVFPGCDIPPAGCEAHHLQPWHQGGATALSNLVLVCKRHHRLIEPNPNEPPDHQWTARLGPHGWCEIIPPTRADPTRTPRLHPRYRIE